MSLESFIGLDKGEGMSEAAFEAFKEKMKAAAAQIAAIKKEEGKQKKKEKELVKILAKFVKTSQKKELVTLISRALEQNIPANFILAIILLGNEDIQKEVGEFLMLESGKDPLKNKELIFFGEKDESLPLKIKIELDNWIKNLMFQAEENPQKLSKTAQGNNTLIQLATFIIRDFLEQNNISEAHEKLNNFAKFIIKGILTKIDEILIKRQLSE
jgi:hypothetical protein